MERTDSRANLLDNDVLELNREVDSHYLSSGYESESEASDSDCCQDVISNTHAQTPQEPDVVMRYSSTASLCEHLKYVLSMPELCDVIFVVGEGRVPIHGVKAILAARSEVFCKIILDSQRKFEERETMNKSSSYSRRRKLKIEVNKYRPEDFRHLMQFVHCGKVKIGDSNLPGLLCGAYQFKLEDLKRACWDYVAYAQRQGTVSKLKTNARWYHDHKPGRKLMSKLTEIQAPEGKVTRPSKKGSKTPEV